MTEQYKQLTAALVYLDSVCDGARAEDTMGFNGTDTKIGKYFAGLIRAGKTLTGGQQKSAVHFLQKYRFTQLLPQLILLPGESEYEVLLSAPIPQKVQPPPPPEKHKIFSRGGVIIVSLNTRAPDFQVMLDGIRDIPERRYENVSKEWHVNKRHSPKLLSFFDGDNAEIHHLVRQWADEQVQADAQLALQATHWKEQEELKKFLDAQSRAIRPILPQVVEGFGLDLRPYQEVPVEIFRRAARSFILADDMGVGKTIESLAVAKIAGQDALPLIVICPPSLTHNWAKEIKRALPEIKYHPIPLAGTMAFDLPVQFANVFILPDSVLPHWTEKIIQSKPGLIIWDEAHRYKNATTQRSMAFTQIAGAARHNMPLTGTPIENSPLDWFPLLSAIDPITWNSRTDYQRRYCEGNWQLRELSDRSRPFIVRRTMADCGEQLPPMQRISVFVPMSSEGRRAYDKRMDLFFEEMELREKQGKSSRGQHLQLIEAMKQAALHGKQDSVLEWIDNFLEASTGKLVVSVLHLEAIEWISNHLKKARVRHTIVSGAESSAEKQKNIDAFQTDKTVRVAVITKAGGLGHTLTAAQDLVTIELWWTPTYHQQVEGRIYRRTQEKHTTMWYLLAEDTIDAQIYDVLNRKLDIINGALSEEMASFEAEKSFIQEVIDRLWLEHKARKGEK